LAKIIRQIKAEMVPAVFLENVTDHRLLDQIARETGAKIGGTLYSDALSDSTGPAATYLRGRAFLPGRRYTLIRASSRDHSNRLSPERSRLDQRVYARLRGPNGRDKFGLLRDPTGRTRCRRNRSALGSAPITQDIKQDIKQ
jgi:substrate-binding protein of zinc uptake complex component A